MRVCDDHEVPGFDNCQAEASSNRNRRASPFLPPCGEDQDPETDHCHASLDYLPACLADQNPGSDLCVPKPWRCFKNGRCEFQCGARVLAPGLVCNGVADCDNGDDEDQVNCGRQGQFFFTTLFGAMAAGATMAVGATMAAGTAVAAGAAVAGGAAIAAGTVAAGAAGTLAAGTVAAGTVAAGAAGTVAAGTLAAGTAAAGTVVAGTVAAGTAAAGTVAAGTGSTVGAAGGAVAVAKTVALGGLLLAAPVLGISGRASLVG